MIKLWQISLKCYFVCISFIRKWHLVICICWIYLCFERIKAREINRTTLKSWSAPFHINSCLLLNTHKWQKSVEDTHTHARNIRLNACIYMHRCKRYQREHIPWEMLDIMTGTNFHGTGWVTERQYTGVGGQNTSSEEAGLKWCRWTSKRAEGLVFCVGTWKRTSW